MLKRFMGGVLLGVTMLGLIQAPASRAQDGERSGQVALIGTDRNVYLYDVVSGSLEALTDNGGRARSYLWPTWSTDGQLAYFGISRVEGDQYNLGLFVHPDPTNIQDTVFSYKTERDTFTYASWSPGDCPATNCRDLFILYTTPRGTLAVRRARSTGEALDVEEIAIGQPFYWDWAPDGQSMLWARSGQTLEIYDVAANQVVQIFDEQQGFQRSVDWSPLDDRFISAVRNADNTSDLVIFDGNKRRVLLKEFASSIAFEWSPNAQQVVFLREGQGDLGLIDLASGDEITISNEALMFQWAPTADKIAFVTIGQPSSDIAAKPNEQANNLFLIWNVYDVATDTIAQVASFFPTQNMVYLFQFFDQFIHSHSLWSPDGRYLVYADITTDGRQVVSIVDVTTDNPQAIEIAEGDIGIFSWK